VNVNNYASAYDTDVLEKIYSLISAANDSLFEKVASYGDTIPMSDRAFQAIYGPQLEALYGRGPPASAPQRPVSPVIEALKKEASFKAIQEKRPHPADRVLKNRQRRYKEEKK
jgi:hypothetical protein